jgi:ubiquinone/menaquinone biosynthesis C-methylase UbiE
MWLEERKVESILELGFGQLNDARFFASHGLKVYGLDFSRTAVEMAKEAILKEGLANISVKEFDFSHTLPFPDQEFDAVYSHFSLHYFDQEITQKVFSEIRRVLKKGGLLIFNVKSVTDWKYGDGNPVGPDMFDDAGDPGHIRHFFRRETLISLLSPLFSILEIRGCTVYYHDHDSDGYDVIATVNK